MMLGTKRIPVSAILACLGGACFLAACGDDSSPNPDVTDTGDVAEAGDEGGACQPGRTWCAGGCVDTQVSPLHCGGCDNPCGAGRTCSAGVCRLRCPSPGNYRDCGGDRCTLVDSDPANCGSCGNACTGSQVCNCGRCEDACSDLDSDERNCGACGVACPGGEECCCGTCKTTCGTPAPACEPPIPAQEPCIARGCTDTRWDFHNCGACGTVCASGELCGNARCTTETCVPTDVYCDGRCVDLLVDIGHCGRCGHACRRDPDWNCLGGVCVPP